MISSKQAPLTMPATVKIPVSETDAALLTQAANARKLPPEALLVNLALRYAEEHGFRRSGPQSLWQRKSPYWGPAPRPGSAPQTFLVSLHEEEREVLLQAANYFKFQAPQGGFSTVTLEQFLLGAALRSLEKPVENKPVEQKTLESKPTVSTPTPKGKPLLGAEGKYVLIVAVGATALVLGAVILKKLDEKKQDAPVVLPTSAITLARDEGAVERDPGPSPTRPKMPLYYGKSNAPSLDAAKNIDALLQQRYGRPTISEHAKNEKDMAKPLWMQNERAGDGTFEALGHLLKALPPDQMYDVDIAEAISDVSAVYPVPAALVKGIIKRESSFNPKALSKTGAVGLMQVMPFNAKRVGLSEQELWIPKRNILGGVRLLAVLLKYYQGDVISALTAYNARPRELFAPLPRNGETPDYVSAVLRYYEEFHGSPLREGAGPTP